MAKLYTLTEIAKKAGVSMPTMQRYKKLYQDRIPSEGKGRKQRYPAAAAAVVRKIKQENLKSRGRRKKKAATAKKTTRRTVAKRKPRKRAAKKSVRRARKSAARATKSGELLSLAEIGRRTGISYPTLIKYQKLHGKRIPHRGKGRRRRYPPAAVAVFRKLRAASGRGRKRPAAKAKRVTGRRAVASDAQLARRVRRLERAQREISRELKSIIALLKKPMRLTVHSR